MSRFLLSGTVSFRVEERRQKYNKHLNKATQNTEDDSNGATVLLGFCSDIVFFVVFLQLVTSSDKYIQHFEYKEGKVLLYFGEVSKPNVFLFCYFSIGLFLNLTIIVFHTVLPSCDFCHILLFNSSVHRE